jgi:alkaline phosphatase
MKNIILIVVSILILGCDTSKKAMVDHGRQNHNSEVIGKPKNIIFMVGDGMGLAQITAGMIYNDGPLNLERINNIGFHKSFSASNLITDSAAGATAFACGIKTYNGAIGVNQDTIPVETILEESEKKGLYTGLIATSTIVHATPASFIAHNKYRRNYEEIALDFLKTDIDIFIGGGRKFFNRRTIDERDLYQELREKGYDIKDFIDGEIGELNIDRNQKFGYLTSDKDPLPAAQGRNYLEPAAQQALDYLSNREQGFFLMIEGSQIDWGGHSNNADYIITEMQDFDRTIGKVLDWAEKDGNTLVVITADHETGGFAINNGSTMDTINAAFTSDYHTATMIPVFAFGPGAEAFRGIYQNTAIYYKMREAFGW